VSRYAILRDPDHDVRLSARREAIRQEEGPPPGRSGFVTKEDLEGTQHRIIHGIPKAPMSCWRW
jgi:hypothetical protein